MLLVPSRELRRVTCPEKDASDTHHPLHRTSLVQRRPLTVIARPTAHATILTQIPRG